MTDALKANIDEMAAWISYGVDRTRNLRVELEVSKARIVELEAEIKKLKEQE